MLTYTYFAKGDFRLTQKPIPKIENDTDAIVKVTLSSICTSDLHIMHGYVPKAVKGITVGHEAVGVVVDVGSKVKNVKVGDRVSVNVETFCGECWFCRRGYVNNCLSDMGGWAMGCRIDGMQAQYVKVPFADTGLTAIPQNVRDKQALLTGDILATGYWAAKISEIEKGDDVLIIGAGPTSYGLPPFQAVGALREPPEGARGLSNSRTDKKKRRRSAGMCRLTVVSVCTEGSIA